MNKPLKSCEGLRACLIWCGDGQYRIRIYDWLGEFEDHDIRIADMFFEFTDDDAWIYEDPATGRRYIDHSPQTLGIQE